MRASLLLVLVVAVVTVAKLLLVRPQVEAVEVVAVVLIWKPLSLYRNGRGLLPLRLVLAELPEILVARRY